MGISFGSINTGLPKNIVQQIIEAEKIPIRKMENRKGKVKDKQALVDELTKLMNDINGHLAKNANARALREFKVDTKDDIVGVTVDKNRVLPASYQLEVTELAQKSSAMSSGFADKDESYIGVGFIQYFLPNGESKEIYVDSDNASLSGVAKLINSDPENGLTANVINDGSGSDAPWRLIMSLNDTGDEKRAHFPYLYFVDGENDFYLEYEREAKDAKVKLDGFEIELPANKTSELIPGVTLDLKKAKPGEEFTLKIDEDTEAVSTKVNDLIEKLNSVFSFIKQQNTMDESTDTSRTLGGDILLQTLESRLRRVVFKDIKTQSGFKRLSDIGITFQRDGSVALDQKKFENVINEDYKMVSQVLAGHYTEGGKVPGFMDNLHDAVKSTLRFPNGLLQSRKNGLQTKIDQIDRRIEQKQRMIANKEKNLKNKFARLESTISRIKTQGAGLAGLGGGGAANPVQQLG